MFQGGMIMEEHGSQAHRLFGAFSERAPPFIPLYRTWPTAMLVKRHFPETISPVFCTQDLAS